MKGEEKEVKKIINGKVYNTETAEKIFAFRRRYQDPVPWREGYVFNTWEDAEYLKTQKGAYLYYCQKRNDLQTVPEEEVKKTISKLDPDLYMELYGELEEG